VSQSASLPLLPTSTTGAYCTPSWLLAARDRIAAGEFGTFDVQETLDDAVLVALDDQRRAGLDVLTDGEMRRQDFIMGFYERLENVRATAPFRKFGYPLYDQVTLYETTGKVRAPNGLGTVEELTFLKRLTDQLVKVAVPGPLTLTTPMLVRQGYAHADELVDDLAAIVRLELERLEAAGCQLVQIDEPAFHAYFESDLGRVTRLFNALVEGLTMKVALHVCFGNFAGRPRSRRSYRPLIPFMAEAHAAQLVLEYANREMAEIDLWPEFGGDKELAAGVVDQKSFYRETADDVAERIRLALRYVRPEKLWLNPDCGMQFTPRWIGRAKLRALVAGARLVRQTLGSP
jgi:5-methyltetrahydropteroyltriglutamate--homocysteine methyltransferase